MSLTKKMGAAVSKCLLCNHEDLSFIPRTQKAWGWVLGREREKLEREPGKMKCMCNSRDKEA